MACHVDQCSKTTMQVSQLDIASIEQVMVMILSSIQTSQKKKTLTIMKVKRQLTSTCFQTRHNIIDPVCYRVGRKLTDIAQVELNMCGGIRAGSHDLSLAHVGAPELVEFQGSFFGGRGGVQSRRLGWQLSTESTGSW